MWSKAKDKDLLSVKTSPMIDMADREFFLKAKRSVITLIQRKVVLSILAL